VAVQRCLNNPAEGTAATLCRWWNIRTSVSWCCRIAHRNAQCQLLPSPVDGAGTSICRSCGSTGRDSSAGWQRLDPPSWTGSLGYWQLSTRDSIRPGQGCWANPKPKAPLHSRRRLPLELFSFPWKVGGREKSDTDFHGAKSSFDASKNSGTWEVSSRWLPALHILGAVWSRPLRNLKFRQHNGEARHKAVQTMMEQREHRDLLDRGKVDR